jgi:hypothetical protein
VTPARDLQERLYRELMDDAALARQKREAARKCDTCRAPLRFARDGDMWLPLDYDEHEGGNWFLFPDGTCYQGRQEDDTPIGATRHYRHTATCRQRPPLQEPLA